MEGSGTPSDPGPWWIVATSGHRAYPFWHKDITVEYDYLLETMPDGLKDHYELKQEPKRKPAPLTLSLEDLFS